MRRIRNWRMGMEWVAILNRIAWRKKWPLKTGGKVWKLPIKKSGERLLQTRGTAGTKALRWVSLMYLKNRKETDSMVKQSGWEGSRGWDMTKGWIPEGILDHCNYDFYSEMRSQCRFCAKEWQDLTSIFKGSPWLLYWEWTGGEKGSSSRKITSKVLAITQVRYGGRPDQGDSCRGGETCLDSGKSLKI